MADNGVESLIAQLGTTGKYQMRQHVLHFITAFLTGMHMFSLTFVAPTPTHRCLIPALDLVNSSMANTFDSAILSQYLPMKADGELDSCRRYNSPFDDNSTAMPAVVSCDGQFVYDTSIYQQSRVYHWNMVCENKSMRAFLQSIYVFGVFCGSLLCGTFADRFGRKIVLCSAGLMQFIFAVMQPYVTNYEAYCMSLFFYGMFASVFVVAYILTMEIVHKSNRAKFGAVFNSSFAVGACFVAVWGYFIRDINILQTVYGLHSIILLSYWWLIDESMRWLWSQGRHREAIDIARRAVEVNKGTFSFTLETEKKVTIVIKPSKSLPQKQQKTYGILDLFRYPTIRLRSVIIAFNWFAVSLCFYGLAFNTYSLPGDPFFVFFIISLADLPGFFMVTQIVHKTGRRSLSATLLFIGGLSCIITTVVPRGWIITTVAMLAKAALAGCFTVLYNCTAELFPTVVRNSALGLSAMASRMGGTLTPFISLLTFLDKRIPPLVFGSIAICAAFIGLFLPETLNKELPQTLEDGEKYGKGDTAFSACFKSTDNNKNITNAGSDEAISKMIP